jgi:hypothetical protein
VPDRPSLRISCRHLRQPCFAKRLSRKRRAAFRLGRARELPRAVSELLLVTLAAVRLDDEVSASIEFPDVCDPYMPMARESTGPVASPQDEYRRSRGDTRDSRSQPRIREPGPAICVPSLSWVLCPRAATAITTCPAGVGVPSTYASPRRRAGASVRHARDWA